MIDHKRKVAGRLSVVIVGIAVMLLSSVLAPLTQTAQAASGNFASFTPEQQAFSYLAIQAIAQCVSHNGIGLDNGWAIQSDVHVDQVNSYRFFDNSTSSKTFHPKIAYYLIKNGYAQSDNDQVDCNGNKSTWIQKAAELWGYTSGQDFICNALNAKRSHSGEACIGSSPNGYAIGVPSGVPTFFYNAISSKVYGGGDINQLPIAAKYALDRDVFAQACNSGSSTYTDAGSQNDSLVFKNFTYVDSSNKLVKKNIAATMHTGDSVWWHSVDANHDGANTCQEIADGMASSAQGYINYLTQYANDHAPCATKYDSDGTLQLACTKGQQNGAAYCDTNYPSSVNSMSDLRVACVYGAKLKTDAEQAAKTTASTSSSGSGSSCGVEGIGWILCPVINFVAKANDNAYNFLATKFLSIDSKLVSDSGVTRTWGTFRNIANIAFVIVFMLIIFAQVTSMGVSNYGIKRMMPRLIVAAILVNLSLIVCQLAVDVSNVVGYSVNSLFDGITVYQGTGTGADGVIAQGLTWIGVVGGVLAAGVGIVALVLTLAAAPTALLAIGAIVLILVARQAIIVLLVILSPLAFVAYLLPNTEDLFKKWYKLFYAMLVLFPVIGVVFTGSKLAARIIAGTSVDPIVQLTALGVSALPLFVVPSLLKGALNATGKLGTTIGGLSSKANARLGNKVKNETQLGRGWSSAMANRAQNRAARQTTALARKPITRGLARLTGGKGFDDSLVNKAAALEDKDFEEGIAASKSKYPNMSFSNIEDAANNSKASEVDRTAAIRHIMEKGNFAQRQKLIESSSTMTDRQRAAVSDGAIARGDHMIYGAGIGDAIKNRKITDHDSAQQYVAQNIAAGKIKPEAMVHDADAVKLMADVLDSGKDFKFKKLDANGDPILDADGKAVEETRTLTAAERAEVSKAAVEAQHLPGTSSKVSRLFKDQYARL